MKANRKFLSSADDKAVSPVIAVILMVAITVVLAATVYVWVSGFGSSSTSATKTVSLSSAGPISSANDKTYTVAAATPGLKWNELSFTLDGTALVYDDVFDGDFDFCVLEAGACAAALPTTTVDAGEGISFRHSAMSGMTLRVIDSGANSVIATISVG